MGVLESRPWADHRVENVSLDQGSSGGRFIVASGSLFRLRRGRLIGRRWHGERVS